ncbi:hypothetical protein ABEV41_01805 [Geobacillus thermodenitrificans]|uniref:hypothetical protein n=1 Tax=Geobacillus thermodenitrificans TaxID=33940 RepID=UPI003D235AEE
MKPVNYDFNTVQNILATKIANLEIQLANEQAAKQAVIQYAESLEKQLEELQSNKNEGGETK